MSYSFAVSPAKLGMNSLKNTATPRNRCMCFVLDGIGDANTPCFRSSSSSYFPGVTLYPKNLTSWNPIQVLASFNTTRRAMQRSTIWSSLSKPSSMSLHKTNMLSCRHMHHSAKSSKMLETIRCSIPLAGATPSGRNLGLFNPQGVATDKFMLVRSPNIIW